MSTSPEHLKKFENLVRNFKDGILVTHSLDDGSLRGRPMYVLQRDDDENFWLATGVHSKKVEEIKKDPRCCMTFQAGSKFISVSGTVEPIQDRTKMNQLWSEYLRVYFPGGPDSEEFCLLKVKSTWAEYWDMSGPLTKLQYAFEAGKAYLRGEHINPEAAAPHEQVKLK